MEIIALVRFTVARVSAHECFVKLLSVCAYCLRHKPQMVRFAPALRQNGHHNILLLKEFTQNRIAASSSLSMPVRELCAHLNNMFGNTYLRNHNSIRGTKLSLMI
uniref:Uncharacterized protein n=1 Tax=Cacopsylla melanoneura TaxID=428564 RepID=A0A8D8PZ08_9HEMI